MLSGQFGRWPFKNEFLSLVNYWCIEPVTHWHCFRYFNDFQNLLVENEGS